MRISVTISLFLILVFVSHGLCSTSDTVPVACYREARLTHGTPEGWTLVRKAGTPKIGFVKMGQSYFIHLSTDAYSGFGIERPLNIDIREYKYIHWTWRAVKLPAGGDIRSPKADDQALQIYLAMSPLGFPQKFTTPVLTYLWDNEAPKGTVVKGQLPMMKYVRYLVIRNGSDELGQWYTEKRNIYEDYKSLFRDVKNGEPLGSMRGIRLYINSQHTGTSAEGFIGDIYFSRN